MIVQFDISTFDSTNGASLRAGLPVWPDNCGQRCLGDNQYSIFSGAEITTAFKKTFIDFQAGTIKMFPNKFPKFVSIEELHYY